MEREARSGEVKTGLFVLVALGLLIFATLWIVGVGLGTSDRRNYEVWLDDAGGVRSGDPVRLAGIEVGRVESVELRASEDFPVVANVAIDRQVTLRQGSSARLTSDGLLGAKFLALGAGPPEAPELGDEPIRGQAGASLEQAMATVANMGDDAGALMQDARAVVNQIGPRLDALLSRGEQVLADENVEELSSTLRALRLTLEEIGPELPGLMRRLDSIASDLEEGMAHVPQLAAQANGVAGDLRQALGPDGERLANTLDSAQATLAAATEAFESADLVLESVHQEGDELQAAIRDLRRTAANLEDLSQTLKQRPDRLLRPRRKADRRPGDGGNP